MRNWSRAAKRSTTRARALLDILFDPVDDFVPRAGDAQHGVGDRFVGAFIIFGEKLLAFDHGVFAAGSEREVYAWVD